MEEIINITVVKEKKPSLLDDFKNHLKEKKTNTYNTNCFNGIYRNNTMTQSDDRIVYFYEFSDLQRQPLKFNKVSHFINWANNHKIYLSSYTENQLKQNVVNYATCYKGSATLIIRSSYELLRIAQNNLDRQYNACNFFNSKKYDDPRDIYDDWWD